MTLLRHIPGTCFQVLLCNELLDVIHSNGFIISASGAVLLTKSWTDSAADRRQRVVLFDEF